MLSPVWRRVKDEVRGRICLWEGMSKHLTLKLLNKQHIRQEVPEALRTLATKGEIILSPVNNRPALLWQSKHEMIDI